MERETNDGLATSGKRSCEDQGGRGWGRGIHSCDERLAHGAQDLPREDVFRQALGIVLAAAGAQIRKTLSAVDI